MRLKEYGRNAKKRKEYVHQPNLLLVGVDVSKAKHSACMGTQTTMSCRKLEFTHTREGFKRFEQTLRGHMVKNGRQCILIAMEPSGIYWQALYERLKSYDYAVCLVHCQAVRNNRKTMPDGTSKTDEKDAASIFDLLRQGKFFLPVARDPELAGCLPLDAAAHGSQETGQSTAEPTASRHSPHISGVESGDQRPDAANFFAISSGQSNARVRLAPWLPALPGTVAASASLWSVAPREISAHL